MKLVLKILAVFFLIAVAVELITRDPYVVYDCGAVEQYRTYPTYVLEECLKHRGGVII
jgi:hypothetical protein